MRKPAPLRLDSTYNGEEVEEKGMEWPPGQTTSSNSARMTGEGEGQSRQKRFLPCAEDKSRRG